MGIKGGHYGYCVKDGGLWCRIGTNRYRVFGNSRVHIALCVVQYIINYYGTPWAPGLYYRMSFHS